MLPPSIIPILMLAIQIFPHVFFPSARAQKLKEPEADCARAGFTASFNPDPPHYKEEELQDARKAALDRHNFYRSWHGASALKQSSELDALAEQAAKCNVKWGSGRYGNQSVAQIQPNGGESYWWRTVWRKRGNNATTPTPFNIKDIAVDAVLGWYSEYCWLTEDIKDGWEEHKLKSHFTQMIWKRTQEFGMGISASSDLFYPDKYYYPTYIFVVARYHPIGNAIKYFDKEVGTFRGESDDKDCCRKREMLRLWNGKLLTKSGQEVYPDECSRVPGIDKPEPPADCAREGVVTTSVQLDPPDFTKEELNAARKAALDRHNYYRRLHGATLMNQNPKIGIQLDSLAEQAAKCNIKWGAGQNGKSPLSTQYGENVYTTSRGALGKLPGPFNITEIVIQAVDFWYSEHCRGPSANPTVTDKPQFTQLVWNSSINLGIGFAGSTYEGENNLKWRIIVVVGRYSPTGNYGGEESTEVGQLTIAADDQVCCRKLEKLLSGVPNVTDCIVPDIVQPPGTSIGSGQYGTKMAQTDNTKNIKKSPRKTWNRNRKKNRWLG